VHTRPARGTAAASDETEMGRIELQIFGRQAVLGVRHAGTIADVGRLDPHMGRGGEPPLRERGKAFREAQRLQVRNRRRPSGNHFPRSFSAFLRRRRRGVHCARANGSGRSAQAGAGEATLRSVSAYLEVRAAGVAAPGGRILHNRAVGRCAKLPSKPNFLSFPRLRRGPACRARAQRMGPERRAPVQFARRGRRFRPSRRHAPLPIETA
jgi:hypothetical protein